MDFLRACRPLGPEVRDQHLQPHKPKSGSTNELRKHENRQLVPRERTNRPGWLKGHPERDAESWEPENSAVAPCAVDPGFVASPLLYTAKMGAYTELWSGLSEDLGIEDGGKYILPWGRVHPGPRPDLLAALKTEEEGGTGNAALFMEYCEKQTAEFR